MDLLSNVLATVRLKASGWHICDFRAPWGFVTKPGFAEPFFLSIVGSACWLTFDGMAPIRMQEGDLILALHGQSYSIASDPEVEPIAWETAFPPLPWSNSVKLTAPRRLAYGDGDGPATRAISAVFGFGDTKRNPLLAALPPYIYLSNSDSHLLATMQSAREFLESEEVAPGPGYVATAERLAELVFISIIRAHLRLQPEQTSGWLRSLSDPRIARAVTAIHERPQHHWTVAGLAEIATMSRAVFAKKFHILVGKSPGDYLTDWRLHLASSQLATTGKPVSTIAEEAGYRSDTAFAQAFKRQFQLTPREYRRAQNG
ncbi:AraC family transcriptional regulator [Sphingomonas sp. AOB5]|uniref:AraC family transcriptional regulator n=1 Tax=Sphingomonas sp. AOB5 TaxID=3034017 RepID=UPI0023F809A3|nr:AraC family transcriptional regulator [Sphingomonas sp. AOB5]MDF7775613.1 AraC family transcriptional regulator [Sphingomonas sp. AOB5]